MFKKNLVLSFLFFIFICSFAAEEYNQEFTYLNSLYYPNPFTNGVTGLSLGVLSLKLLSKKQPLLFKRFPHLEAVLYGTSSLFPILINVWRAKKLYDKLSYDYIIKHFDSVKRHDYWFDKSAMIDDLKMNLLEKSEFQKDSDSYKKYKILLDILTKSPKKIIEGLKDYDQQKNFLSAVLLLDAEKVGHLNFENQTNIKEAFKEISALNKKISDSLFFNTSQTINYFLNGVDSSIGAQFIVRYKDDIKSFVDSFISLDKTKQQNILSAMLKIKEKNEDSGKNTKPWLTKSNIASIIIIIIFDLIVEIFLKSNEAAHYLLENLSDENFWSLINYVFLNKDQSSFKDKLNTFSGLIKYCYQKNKENFSDPNNPFIKKTNFLKTKDKENQTNILEWWLSVAGYKKNQSQQETKSTVNLAEKQKSNNYQNAFPLNNPSAQSRLISLFSIPS